MLSRIPCLLLSAVLMLAQCLSCGITRTHADDAKPSRQANLKLLFLGDNGNHKPRQRADDLLPALALRGIEVVYTDRVSDLNPETLAQYQGLIVYANIDTITPEQEQALLAYVENGGGYIPLHSASFCFRNSTACIQLLGAQFRRHGGQEFRTVIAEPDHPLMQGFSGFESWDETYIHQLHNPHNRTVLEYRVQGDQAEGNTQEPWTWIRTQGKGRVFYTAWGHDQRTFSHPGFHNLVERGIRWACRGDLGQIPAYSDGSQAFPLPQITKLPENPKPFEYIDVGPKIPDYSPGGTSGARKQPKNLMQRPLPARESLAHFVTPVDFRVELFASDPELQGKPISMNWDESGRLWLCETYDYPNELRPPGEGRDRIRVCEDTNGDGLADRFTIFAEKLSIPSTLTFHRGGVIVQDGSETLYLKDTDGDGKADVRHVLLTGWTMSDTHGGVSNFQYGLDNWFWGMQGYNASTPTIEGVPQQSFRQGFWRFRLNDADPPVVTDLEFVRSTNNNTWGLGFSEEGLIFGSTANRNPSVFMPIPNRYYERVQGWTPDLVLPMIADTHLFKPITDNIRQVDHHGGYTAAAGHALYTARAYPREYWNQTAFVCGPTGHLVGTFVLQPDGAGYRSRNLFNLLASDDEWSAPIMAEVGPDGCVWVIDWYNFIVQHNPTPIGFERGAGNAYVSDLRDKKLGRIYRIVPVDGEIASTPDLRQASLQELVENLKHPTFLVRRHAQRLLVEQAASQTIPSLLKMIEDQTTDEIGLNVGAMHALQTLNGLGAITQSPADASPQANSSQSSPVMNVVVGALKHPSAGVRRNAVQVLPDNAEGESQILQFNLLRDPHPQVRLAALLKLSDCAKPGVTESPAADALVELVQDEAYLADRWQREAVTIAAASQHLHFLQRIAAAAAEPSASQRLSSPAALALVRLVSEHVARSSATAPAGMERLVHQLDSSDPRLLAVIVEGLAAGWPGQVQLPLDASSKQAITNWLKRLPPESQSRLISLALAWGHDEIRQELKQVMSGLIKTLENEKRPLPERLAAARQIIVFDPANIEQATTILDLITPQATPELTTGLMQALSASTAKGLGSEILQAFTGMTPVTRQEAIRLLMSRPDLTLALLEALEAGAMQLSELSLDQKQALRAHPDKQLATRSAKLLERGGSLPSPDRQRVLQEFLPLVELTGNVEQGKTIFKAQCAKCHRFQGEGEEVGPDLTGMALHPKRELLAHILDPNSSVEANFRTYTITTLDGRIFTGMLSAETRTSLELIDTQAKRHPILRADIDELLVSNKSLMPEGFEKQIPREDWPALLEYLTQKGKYIPLNLASVATIASDTGMFNDKQSPIERLIFPDWKPKLFAGVPFQLIDPLQGQRANVIMLHGTNGQYPPQMPRTVKIPCGTSVRAIHLLSGVSGWGYPAHQEKSDSLTVRLHYEGGQVEDHVLKNGVHFADYIRRVDVPESTFAFALRNQQIRHIAIAPQRSETITEFEFIKGNDPTSPVIMAITIERPE
ncbi:MAG: ThuA domain-containing protein [Planctomycetaceae bacterium]|nr:ThuA domain-containing protein [Planctomycetaceae bacterium]